MKIKIIEKERIIPSKEWPYKLYASFKGKITKTKKKELVKIQSLLEIIHTDICGLLPTPT